jgi:hypothetical protein
MAIVDCTPEKPWDRCPAPGVRIRHSRTKEVGDQQAGYPGGDLVTVRCMNCGHEWEQELPQ